MHILGVILSLIVDPACRGKSRKMPNISVDHSAGCAAECESADRDCDHLRF